jgi:hypothetical protein
LRFGSKFKEFFECEEVSFLEFEDALVQVDLVDEVVVDRKLADVHHHPRIKLVEASRIE